MPPAPTISTFAACTPNNYPPNQSPQNSTNKNAQTGRSPTPPHDASGGNLTLTASSSEAAEAGEEAMDGGRREHECARESGGEGFEGLVFLEGNRFGGGESRPPTRAR